MIQLTRFNGRAFVLNAEQIKSVEETPDTMILLLNGEQIMVQESMAEVVRRAIEYGRALRAFPVPALEPRREDCAAAQVVPRDESEV